MNSTTLLTNPLLDFTTGLNLESGEVANTCSASYKGLKFIIRSNNYIEIQGSLHKYFNNGVHNYNDFTLLELHSVLDDLANAFHLNLNNCIVKNMEFGVNIKPPFITSKILNNLMLHKASKFYDVQLKSGNYKQAPHQQYYVKIYDKAKQYLLLQNLMRYELKFTKSCIINKLGITTLNDLLGSNWIELVKIRLLREWNQIVLFDYRLFSIDTLTARYRNKLSYWSNPNYWSGLTKQSRFKAKNRYSNLLDDNFQISLHSSIAILIQEKFNDLAKKGYQLTTFKKTKRLPFNTSSIGLNSNL